MKRQEAVLFLRFDLYTSMRTGYDDIDKEKKK
jgi:hypothetical protein